MTSTDPLVSVLTPVYNGEPYIAACIESVLAQTYTNWEYVILNNCSTDGSLSIALHYAARDSRIRVLDNESFLDVLQNHNRAFRQTSSASKYTKMLQADDLLFPECLRRMVDVAEAHPTVGLVGAYRLDDRRVGCDGLPYPSPVISGRDLCRSTLLGGPGVFGSMTSLLVRSDLVSKRDPFLDESDFHSDTSVCYEILKGTDFGFVHQVLTFTRRHPAAQTSMAESLNTYQAGQLRRLLTYGVLFLSTEEYERRREDILDEYYRFLAQRCLEPGAREVWSYHRQALDAMGYPLRWLRMLRALLPYWHRAFAHPLDGLRVLGRIPAFALGHGLRNRLTRSHRSTPGSSASPVPPTRPGGRR